MVLACPAAMEYLSSSVKGWRGDGEEIKQREKTVG